MMMAEMFGPGNLMMTPFGPMPTNPGSFYNQPGLQKAMAVNPMETQAREMAMNTLQGGGMMDAVNSQFGPIASSITKNWQETALPSIASQMGRAGRTGSGAHGFALGRASEGLADALSRAGANIYGQERGRQMQTMGMVPTFNQMEAYRSDAPMRRIMQMANMGQMLSGTQQTQSTPTQWSPLGTALGMASTAGGLGWTPFS
jgi:hypothetical protein